VIKLIVARLFEKEQKLEVIVEDKKGRRREVTFRWLTKEFTPLPDHWMASIEAELEHQDAEELAKNRGRMLIR
jgi:hypothetical protein